MKYWIVLSSLISCIWTVFGSIDCHGKAFHCVNSSSFTVCVDFGGGISKTFDDFIIHCPEGTTCRNINENECETEKSTTSNDVGVLALTEARQETTFAVTEPFSNNFQHYTTEIAWKTTELIDETTPSTVDIDKTSLLYIEKLFLNTENIENIKRVTVANTTIDDFVYATEKSLSANTEYSTEKINVKPDNSFVTQTESYTFVTTATIEESTIEILRTNTTTKESLNKTLYAQQKDKTDAVLDHTDNAMQLNNSSIDTSEIKTSSSSYTRLLERDIQTKLYTVEDSTSVNSQNNTKETSLQSNTTIPHVNIHETEQWLDLNQNVEISTQENYIETTSLGSANIEESSWVVTDLTTENFMNYFNTTDKSVSENTFGSSYVDISFDNLVKITTESILDENKKETSNILDTVESNSTDNKSSIFPENILKSDDINNESSLNKLKHTENNISAIHNETNISSLNNIEDVINQNNKPEITIFLDGIPKAIFEENNTEINSFHSVIYTDYKTSIVPEIKRKLDVVNNETSINIVANIEDSLSANNDEINKKSLNYTVDSINQNDKTDKTIFLYDNETSIKKIKHTENNISAMHNETNKSSLNNTEDVINQNNKPEITIFLDGIPTANFEEKNKNSFHSEIYTDYKISIVPEIKPKLDVINNETRINILDHIEYSIGANNNETNTRSLNYTEKIINQNYKTDKTILLYEMPTANFEENNTEINSSEIYTTQPKSISTLNVNGMDNVTHLNISPNKPTDTLKIFEINRDKNNSIFYESGTKRYNDSTLNVVTATLSVVATFQQDVNGTNYKIEHLSSHVNRTTIGNGSKQANDNLTSTQLSILQENSTKTDLDGEKLGSNGTGPNISEHIPFNLTLKKVVTEINVTPKSENNSRQHTFQTTTKYYMENVSSISNDKGNKEINNTLLDESQNFTSSYAKQDVNRTIKMETKTINELLKVNNKIQNEIFNVSKSHVHSEICKSTIRYPSGTDCRYYNVCITSYTATQRKCPNNTIFSPIIKQCTTDLSQCIIANQFHCITPGKFGDYYKRNIYYICVKPHSGFIRIKLQCNANYVFDKTALKCIPFSKVMDEYIIPNITRNNVSKDSDYEGNANNKDDHSYKFECKIEGRFPHTSNDRRKYFKCVRKSNSKFRKSTRKCDDDEIFDAQSQKCVDKESNESDSDSS